MLDAGDLVLKKEFILQKGRQKQAVSVQHVECSDGPERFSGSLGREDPLEEGMATHSSIRACRILWTEEPGRR